MTKKTFAKQLDKVVKVIVRQYKPQKVILFGSAAAGKINQDSDADLAIVKQTEKSFYDRIGDVSSLVPHKIPLDIIVYTPTEFAQMSQDEYGYFVREEILEKGKVLYEAN